MLKKLSEVERELAGARGEFTLFGLVQRRESSHWDLVLAAEWINAGLQTVWNVASDLQRRLSVEEALLLSRIVPLAPDDGLYKAMLQTVSVRHGLERVSGVFGQIEVSDDYIITCGHPPN